MNSILKSGFAGAFNSVPSVSTASSVSSRFPPAGLHAFMSRTVCAPSSSPSATFKTAGLREVAVNSKVEPSVSPSVKTATMPVPRRIVTERLVP